VADEQVILVDESDNELGTCEKLEAHLNGGRLHRAFSVFLFHPDGRLFLQRRAAGKYHFPGLWTNACCSHPRPGESTDAAAHRRLGEELGIDAEISEAFAFVYRAEDPASGLTEHEFDHVFLGTFDGEPNLNLSETDAYRWISRADLLVELETSPENFTPWFKIALERVLTSPVA
jgi:isopentenyl-diphosphate delta-isomerase